MSLNRRDAIQRAAIAAGLAFAPAWLRVFEAQPSAQGTTRHLWAIPFANLSAFAERLLPKTDTPGALDAGVPAFVDRLYGEFMSPAERQMVLAGLDGLDVAARSAHGAPFRTLTAVQQDAVLRDIARAEEGTPQGFFRLVRSAVILGYFTSEVVGRNVLNYDPVPGRLETCVPIDQVGRRNWTT